MSQATKTQPRARTQRHRPSSARRESQPDARQQQLANPRPAQVRQRVASPAAPTSQLQPAEVSAASPNRPSMRFFVEGNVLARGFVYFALAVATLMFLMFASDLIFGWPFWRQSPVVDGVFVMCALAMGYLTWNVAQELD